ATITCCIENIEEELHRPIDTHTATILSRHIELMLDYCTRFYERQFITREHKNKSVLKELEALLDAYIASGRLRDALLPTPEYCAVRLGLSVPYFNDLLKFETGKTLDEYFQQKRLEVARRMLLVAGNTPALVAHRLGYANVQCFSLLFKKVVGVAPACVKRGDN
ncbi:MAG: AraC family transcriptional regulator, partial [Bacteroides sp.]|nr:AraC family transcriptional regulator [Bacteroides sp.]